MHTITTKIVEPSGSGAVYRAPRLRAIVYAAELAELRVCKTLNTDGESINSCGAELCEASCFKRTWVRF